MGQDQPCCSGRMLHQIGCPLAQLAQQPYQTTNELAQWLQGREWTEEEKRIELRKVLFAPNDFATITVSSAPSEADGGSVGVEHPLAGNEEKVPVTDREYVSRPSNYHIKKTVFTDEDGKQTVMTCGHPECAEPETHICVYCQQPVRQGHCRCV